MRIAMIGTRGVPARYGGFETAVEEVGRRLVSAGHEVLVYCRGERTAPEHLGMALVHLPAVRVKVGETLSHTALSVWDLRRREVDVALVFNAANALLLPGIRVPTAVHVDGLEWKRAKWSGAGRAYYQLAERLAVRWADALIADAGGIRDYYRERYDADSHLIAYGAPVLRDLPDTLLARLGLTSRGYHLVVARLEPENLVHVSVEGYLRSSARLPLVVVGSAPYSPDYTRELHATADSSGGRVRMVGAVWDQDLLNQLYGHSATYLHGHSVGGTNPSLLRAMGTGAPVLAYDVVFSREVLGPTGCYFASAAQLAPLLDEAEADLAGSAARGRAGQDRAAELYRWDDVAEQYAQLCEELVKGATARRRAMR